MSSNNLQSSLLYPFGIDKAKLDADIAALQLGRDAPLFNAFHGEKTVFDPVSVVSKSIPARSEIMHLLVSEREALKFFESKGVIQPLKECPSCGGRLCPMSHDLCSKSRFMVRCRSKKCSSPFRGSVLSGSIVAQCKYNKAKFIDFSYMWLMGCKSTHIKKTLGMSKKTVTDWSNYLREAVTADILNNDDCQIGGPGIIVEIDESKFGKRKYHRGKKVEGCWVFGGVERLEPNSENPFQEQHFSGEKCRLGKMFSVVVEKRDARTLIPILRRFVRPGSVIYSDQWGAYCKIEDVHEGNFYYYQHMTVNHSVCFKDPTTLVHTNTCEGAWRSQYKSQIPSQAYNKYALQGHLFERVWKRKYMDDLWNSLWRVLEETRFERDDSAPTKKLIADTV